MTNPRQAEVEAALAGFQWRVDHGKVPPKRRYHRVVGAPAGTYQHRRRKRNEQRRNAGNWRVRP